MIPIPSIRITQTTSATISFGPPKSPAVHVTTEAIHTDRFAQSSDGLKASFFATNTATSPSSVGATSSPSPILRMNKKNTGISQRHLAYLMYKMNQTFSFEALNEQFNGLPESAITGLVRDVRILTLHQGQWRYAQELARKESHLIQKQKDFNRALKDFEVSKALLAIANREREAYAAEVRQLRAELAECHLRLLEREPREQYLPKDLFEEEKSELLPQSPDVSSSSHRSPTTSLSAVISDSPSPKPSSDVDSKRENTHSASEVEILKAQLAKAKQRIKILRDKIRKEKAERIRREKAEKIKNAKKKGD